MDTTLQVLTPVGILDGTKAEEIRAQVNSALSDGASTLLMDLKETTFVDSSGLGTLVSVLKKVRSQDFCSLGKAIVRAPANAHRLVFVPLKAGFINRG